MQNVKKQQPEVFFKKLCNILMKIPVLESLLILFQHKFPC